MPTLQNVAYATALSSASETSPSVQRRARNHGCSLQPRLYIEARVDTFVGRATPRRRNDKEASCKPGRAEAVSGSTTLTLPAIPFTPIGS